MLILNFTYLYPNSVRSTTKCCQMASISHKRPRITITYPRGSSKGPLLPTPRQRQPYPLQKDSDGTTIEEFKSINYYEDGQFQYRLRLTRVNGAAKICLSKFWWKDSECRYLPTTFHHWLPLTVWPGLVQSIEEMDEVVKDFQNDTSSGGMYC